MANHITEELKRAFRNNQHITFIPKIKRPTEEAKRFNEMMAHPYQEFPSDP